MIVSSRVKSVVVGFACATLVGCGSPSASRGRSSQLPAPDPVVEWSAPVAGLSLGIERPGPVDSLHDEPRATVVARLKNNTSAEIVWSDSMSAWSVSFGGAGWQPPEPFTDPKPAPYVGAPLHLGPHEEATIEIPIVRAYLLWPPVPAGEYTLAVAYEPAHLRTLTVGDVRPFDDPRFWGDSISTPSIAVEVRGSH